MTERWERIQQIFDAVAELPEGERAASLAKLTDGDPDLRGEVESLLAAEAKTRREFLDSPPPLARDLRRAMTGEFLVGRTLGRYRLESLLHEGGMGLVFHAIDQQTEQAVALKLLPPESATSEDLQRQFEREAAALRKLDHPGVVKLLNFGSEGGFRYLVMELVPGRGLRELLREGPAGIDLAEQLAVALGAIHRAGVVHGDIKPENLLVTPEGKLKVVDFGLTREVSPASVRETVEALGLTGTIAYSAPERIRGEPPTATSDVFAAGVTIFEMLTGQALFTGKTPWAVAEQILQGRPNLRPAPTPVRPVLRRCLQSQSRRRFPDGAALGEALGKSQRAPAWWRTTAAKGASAVIALMAAAAAWQVSHVPVPPREISLGTGVSAHLVLSPDGKRVAYARRNPLNRRETNIFVRETSQGNERQLTKGGFRDRWPSFSSDGMAVFFESDRQPPGIYRQGLNDRAPVLVVEGGHAPRVSPDGKLMIYYSRALRSGDAHSSGAGVALAAIAAGMQRLWFREDLVPLAPAVWNPDSKTAAVTASVRGSTETSGLVLFEATDGSYLRRFTYFGEICGWRADGTWFGTTGHPGMPGLLEDRQLASTNKPVKRMAERGDLSYCAVSADGWWGVQAKLQRGLLGASLDPDSELPKGQLVLDPKFDGAMNPSISADDEWLLFATKRPVGEGTLQVAEYLPTGRRLNVAASAATFPGLPKLAASTPLLLAHRSLPSGLMLRLPSLEQIHAVPGLETAVWDISRDGLMLSASPGLPRAIRVQDIGNGAVSTVLFDPKRNLYLADLSPDEQWLVFTAEEMTSGAPFLYVAPFHRGVATPQSEWVRLGTGDYPQWSATGRTVYFLDESLPVPELRAQRVDGVSKRPVGEPVRLHSFAGEWTPGDLQTGSFRIAASRRRILVTVGKSETRLIEGR